MFAIAIVRMLRSLYPVCFAGKGACAVGALLGLCSSWGFWMPNSGILRAFGGNLAGISSLGRSGRVYSLRSPFCMIFQS
jgi:hypothetical protein